MNAAANKLLDEFQQLDTSQSYWDDIWREVLAYCMPEERTERTGRTEGESRPAPVDVTAVVNTEKLASFLYANTIATGSEWFVLRGRREEDNDSDEFARWLSEAGDICIKSLQDSNFATKLHAVLRKIVCLGTGCIYVDRRNGRTNFREYPIHDVRVARGRDGVIDRVYRKFRMTASEAAAEWGEDALPQDIRKAAAVPQDKHKPFDFLHVVAPRDGKGQDPGRRDAKALPFASFYIARDSRHVVSESGYSSMPYAIARFDEASDEVLGRGPALRGLPAIRAINRVARDHMEITEMAAWPPIFVEGELDARDMRLVPGAVNYYAQGSRPPEQYQVNAQVLAYTGAELQRQAENLRQLFYIDLFAMMEEASKAMTATEVNERSTEKMQALAAVVVRLHSELFTPLVERALRLLLEDGTVPPPPPGFEDRQWDVAYTTRMDAKLAQVEVNNIRSTVAISREISDSIATYPEDLRPLFDMDRITRKVAHALNVDPDLVRSEYEADKARKAMQQAAAAAQAEQAQREAFRPMDPMQAPQPGSPLDMLGRGR
jgi:hypothetical protein